MRMYEARLLLVVIGLLLIPVRIIAYYATCTLITPFPRCIAHAAAALAAIGVIGEPVSLMIHMATFGFGPTSTPAEEMVVLAVGLLALAWVPHPLPAHPPPRRARGLRPLRVQPRGLAQAHDLPRVRAGGLNSPGPPPPTLIHRYPPTYYPRPRPLGSAGETKGDPVVRIRMQRMGRHRRPFYRINAVDARNPRDGTCLEQLGWFDPLAEGEKQLKLDEERVKYWLSKGAQPSDTVRDILGKRDLLPPNQKAAWEARRKIDRQRVEARKKAQAEAAAAAAPTEGEAASA